MDSSPLVMTETEIPWLDSVDVDQLLAWMSDESVDDNTGDRVTPAASAAEATTRPPSTSTATTSRVAPRDHNATRRRQKEELAHLRDRVVELEEDLERLRASQLRSVDAKANSNVADVVAGENDAAWERIASRQRLQRRRAEIENYKLRQMLESQLRVAETLDRLLRKRPNIGTTDEAELKRPRRLPIDGDAALPDDVLFRRLQASVEQSHSEMHRVFEQNGLFTAPVGHRSVQIRAMNDRREDGTRRRAKVFVEMSDVATLPFSLEATAKAAWHCITSGYMQVDHEVYSGLSSDPNSDNMLAIKYAVTLSRRRLQVNMNARALMKRFIDGGADQIVDVWDASSVTSTSGVRNGSSEPGMQVIDRGWTVFRRHGPSSTVVYTCMQMIPLISYANSTEEERQVGLITNLALDYYGDQLDKAQQAMESMLLDNARVW
ncbi:hypothetical protein PINS_up005369 [Pythium insidiosum]|nr:hypothetical protein PINS_up005369 [Pythium insidiosum]